MKKCLAILSAERNKRVKPQLDNKVIVSWNALMCHGLVAAYQATGTDRYLSAAKDNMAFLLKNCWHNNRLLHVITRGHAHVAANLEDYAAMIQALLSLFGETGNSEYLEKAMECTRLTEQLFLDSDTGLFLFGDRSENQLPADTMELFDHAVPSGNALMAMNYQKLFAFTDVPSYEKSYIRMAGTMSASVEKFPTSFGFWLNALLPLRFSQAEVVVAGPAAIDTMKKVHQLWHPMKLSMVVCDNSLQKWPISADRYLENVTRIFLCRNRQCAAPVNQVSEFREQLFAF